MNELRIATTATSHQLYRTLLRLTGRGRPPATDPGADHGADDGADRDRGAVSLEQVLWYVAAGVAVAVIAGILWDQIRDQANTPVVTPTAPNP